MNKVLQKALAVTSLVIPAIALSATDALAAQQDFRLHNKTGSTMLSFQIALPINNTPWSSNILSNTLSSGYFTWVTFGEDLTHCVFDIRATFRDGSVHTNRVNLCDTTDYTVYRY
jgi:hypothetical protein